jgi:predicted ATPase
MLHRARQLAHPHTLALALCFASVLHRWMGRAAETLVLSAETIAVSREHGFPVWLAAGEMTHGWAQVRQGGNETGIVELQSSIAGMRVAIRGISVVFLSALVEAYVALGRPAEALAVIADAMDDVDRSGDGHFTAELWRLQGECRLMLSSGNRAEAADCFARALGLSRRQNSTVLELRAAMSLARHFKDVKPLAEVYSRFDEGFDSPDLVEAAGLVEPESLSCAPSGLPDGAAA